MALFWQRSDPVRSHERGFSLVEMAVVLGVIGITAVLAGPNLMIMLKHMRNKAAVSDIASMMRLGRGMAMEENLPFALVIRTGSASDPNDDQAALIRCPSGTAGTYDFSSISADMLDGNAPLPASFSIVRRADIAAEIGIGPGSNGVLTVSGRFYASVPRNTGCTFCSGGVGAIVFKSDGTLTLSNGDDDGSVTVSISTNWPTPSASEMYTVSVMGHTGEVRVWH
jgi:prepilin-type N-terminal cleavage/methylation domain-containing protein